MAETGFLEPLLFSPRVSFLIFPAAGIFYFRNHPIHTHIHALSTCTDGDVAMKRKLARIGVDTFLKMCFNDNFVHGDLHPGNILVSEAHGEKPMRVIFLDAGITTVCMYACMHTYTRCRCVMFVSEAHGDKCMRVIFLDAGITTVCMYMHKSHENVSFLCLKDMG